jgi:hypothetical protein
MENKEFAGLRRPTAYECERITKHIQAEYGSYLRFRVIFALILGVLGLLLMIGGGTAGLITGILCLISAGYAVYGRKRLNNIIKTYETGNFSVLDAKVDGIIANPDQPGAYSIKCSDKTGNQIPGLFKARKEDLSVGQDIIYVKCVVDGEKNPLERVFTPYMLTDEGIKKHW